MSTKLNYCNGMNKHSAEKVAKFTFGAFFKDIEVDETARMFHLKMHESIKQEGNVRYFKDEFAKDFRDYFKTFWGTPPGFDIVVVRAEEVSLEDSL